MAVAQRQADPAGVYFSERFGVDPDVLESYGALDISVATDLPLFIDPFLLFNSDNDTYQALHTQIIDYLRFLKSRSVAGLDPKLISAWYRFAEVKQNWLGFTQDGNDGHGLGPKFAAALHAALSNLLPDFGAETVTESTHLEKLALITDRVGRDNVSDFTTNLIKHYLLTYTQTFAVTHLQPDQIQKFRVPRAAFNYNTESWATRAYTLPALDGDFVLLTPLDMLTKDDTWINRSDMIGSYDSLPDSVTDEEQRALINNYFSQQLGFDPKPEDVAAAKARTIAAFPELIDLYIARKEESREEATSISAQKTNDTRAVLVDQVQIAANDLAAKTDFYSKPWTSIHEALDAVVTFKHYVEHQDGYTVINRGGGKAFATEKEVQGFFGLLLQRSRFDVNREPNNGRGPVDFAISAGAFDKSLIEFKLAKSGSLKRNLSKQLEIYLEANKTPHGVKVIISYSDLDHTRAMKVLSELGLADNCYVVMIDARATNKPSASVA
jgi:hypothetical protein